nr:hypothetical protein [Chitinophagaceae bacterium]
KYIISGSNLVTEGILPKAWGYDASDFYHIKSVHKKFGTQKIKTFPSLTLVKYFYYMLMRGVKKINLLNYVEYNKALAIEELTTKVGWEYYGGKHYESIFTQFFQAHVLPVKFGFDKRRAHLSTLVCSNQITREEAMSELSKPLYNPELLKMHIEYLQKKWELTDKEYIEIMSAPPKKHENYPNNRKWIDFALKIKKILNA